MPSSASLTNYETPKNNAGYTNPAGNMASSMVSYPNGKNSGAVFNFNVNSSNLKRNSLNTSSIKSNFYHQFSISNSNNPANFYFRTLLRYVRSGNEDNFQEKVHILNICFDFYFHFFKF